MGLGAILAQKQFDGSIRPIAYASRTLQQHEKKYGTKELEALGVVWLVKHYLYGHQCIAIEIIAEYPTPIGEDSTSGLALQEVVLTLHCRSHRTNGAANSLFRFPVLQPL